MLINVSSSINEPNSGFFFYFSEKVYQLSELLFGIIGWQKKNLHGKQSGLRFLSLFCSSSAIEEQEFGLT